MLLLALFISFVGTLPPGLITLTITQTTIEEGKKAAWLTSLGATIPEFIYTYIALIGANFLLQNEAIGYYIQVASAVLFLTLGVYFWLAKPKVKGEKASVDANHGKFFQRGLAAGFFNFLIVPFWLFVVVWLRSNGYVVEGHLTYALFSLAGALGAFGAFLLYIELGGWIVKKFASTERYFNRGIGTVFLVLALYQVYEVLNVV